MSNQFDAPTAPPQSNAVTAPWDFRLNFKSGKTQEGYAQIATPEMAKAGFTYYDKDAAQNYKLEQLFTGIVVAVLAGVQGVTQEGDRYLNYYSNLVKDTSTDALQVRVSGIDKIQHQGLYADFKSHLPQGVGFTQVFIVYAVEQKKYFALSLTVGLQNHLKRAIGKATGTKPEKVSLFGLCDLTTKYWGFKFDGKMSKYDKDGNTWQGKGEMYFYPDCTCFTINKKAETADWFELLGAASEKVSEYLSRSQERAWKPTDQKEVSQDLNFPTTEPPISNAVQVEVPADQHTDDLPF